MRLHVMLAAAAILTACSPLTPQELGPRIDKLAAAGDTAALATLAHDHCRATSGDDRQACLEDFFLTLAAGHRVRLALGALERLGASDGEVAREGHGYTHVIGIRAWKPGDDVAEVFRSCTGLYQSGCYHGVIQAYLTEGGALDSARAISLCDQVAAAPEDRWLRFQCVHGLGHGFEMALAWELPRALSSCDWLGSWWDRESCYGGAFMENAVASQPGRHHTSARALAASAEPESAGHAGHAGHTPDPGAIAFRMRDSSDALYPCTVLDQRYLRSCFQVQGGIILNASGQDFGVAATECNRAPEGFRRECYLSLGTNASGSTGQSTEASIAHCRKGDPAYQPWCFVGAVKNFIDVTARPEDGIRFCREVAPGDNRAQCWRAVGEQVATLYPTDPVRRTAACALAAADGVAPCRLGALL